MNRIFDTPTPDLNGTSLLITGGTGSFGQAFVKNILDHWAPNRIIIFSRDELKPVSYTHLTLPTTPYV